MINRKNAVELEAFKQIKDAEALNRKADAEATAAIKMAEARRTEAQASTDVEKLQAEALKAMRAAEGLAEADVTKARAQAAFEETEAIKARGLAEAEGQHAMSDALAANEGVAQRLEPEKIRVSAQVEVGVAQAKSMGEAVAAMDFRLYGTLDTAQQVLRMMSLNDGIGNLLQTAPVPLRDVGGRIVDSLLPNGNNGQGANQRVNGLNLQAVQPLIAEASIIVTSLLNADARKQLSVELMKSNVPFCCAYKDCYYYYQPLLNKRWKRQFRVFLPLPHQKMALCHNHTARLMTI
ncbi:MAG: hypothetical protein GFH27_549287n130 [Chloroflexi bacterium AL-W]|nr:hypothetical protein [Chloroflexi bacterium AL-N1]NOK66404.1 hypothetical protein [Chloroflexi bacterium AL-N10]NOK71792.1 hypothetical protein [Chloroflexi bacterium AL-N5]NOK81049.1 hypothetical protein [Chloroflexi bacterium AL-W]NOK89322.1 hypothetical protein [Chloroflexi bacterium AL-N15]